jgi:hypothetical protein
MIRGKSQACRWIIIREKKLIDFILINLKPMKGLTIVLTNLKNLRFAFVDQMFIFNRSNLKINTHEKSIFSSPGFFFFWVQRAK